MRWIIVALLFVGCTPDVSLEPVDGSEPTLECRLKRVIPAIGKSPVYLSFDSCTSS